MAIERPTFHESWYRVAELHPRLRSTVQISRQHFRGLPWHVVQDHTNNAFFRLAEPAYRFIGLLDGKRSVGEAWKIVSDQMGDEAPTQGEVIQLLGQLYTSNLLQAEVPADTHTLFGRYRKRKQREVTSYLMNIMFARMPIVDPDNFLNRWLPVLGWIFSPLGLVVWVVLISIGCYSVVQSPGWQNELGKGAAGLLAPDNLVWLYLAFAMIKACHEMGHAISCKKFGRQGGTGGEVHVIGIMFLVFTPVPYVDASSSWALRNKWHRAIVGAAGMWVELAIASVAAVIWSQTGTTQGSAAQVLHAFSYNIMFVASFSTIVFNANPLLRYDGYYILSDVLEIPNLAQRSKEYIYHLVKRWVWNVRFSRSPAQSAGERIWLFFYAIASFLMRTFVTFSIMFYLSTVLNGTLIILATAMALAGLITWIFVPLGKFLHYLATSSELARVRGRAISTTLLAVIGIVMLVGVVQFPDRARAQGVVEPVEMYELFAGGEGATTWMIEKQGGAGGAGMLMPVSTGTVILRQENRELFAQREGFEAQLKQADAVWQMELARNSAGIDAADVDRQKIRDQIALVDEQIARLTLKSPMDGVLIAPQVESKRFAYMKEGEKVGIVANMGKLFVRAAASNELVKQIRMEMNRGGGRVEIRVEGRPDILLTGVASVPESGSHQLPSAALGFQVGGQLSTESDDRSGTKTSESFFEVRVDDLTLVNAPLEASRRNGDLPLLPGQRVVVRFEFDSKPLAEQAWIKLRQVFQKSFQL